MKKITSVSGQIFLFKEIPNKRRNEMGIASGESVLLSIYENDQFYFSQGVNLIKYKNISKEEVPTNLEIDFFKLVREAKELKYKKSLVKEYGIEQFIHYLPKITFKQVRLSSEQIEITGSIRYPESVHEKEVPIVYFKKQELPLEEDTYFTKIISPIPKNKEKIPFTFQLSKQVITKSCTIH
ncbi:hypothetical protein [Enterococcus mundtii]|uniref:hypothetical protein n=1 Tax=Enterococcus mundtii TaxID=53346 RepID=UPI00189A63BD|nr:hypothetical protein [Enterococcus mundtii]MBO1084939.1 hypothetical protein [Enterococcus mundtii]MDV7743805.1 hypothetical protein [Enterococcus mundtii]